MSDTIRDIVIIGGGPAGYSAALYSARAGFDTVVIEKMCAGGQMTLTDTIDNYPGFEEGIDGFTLGDKMRLCAERFGAKTVLSEVFSVDFSQPVKKLNTSAGEISCHAVIIASGAEARKLGIEHEEDLIGKGVHYCAHCDGRFYKGKTVLVIGGGNSAVSDALYLSRLAEKVILVHRRDTLRATKLYHDQILNIKNIEFRWDSELDGFVYDTRVSGAILKNVKTGESETVSCDGIFISIGRNPSTAFLSNAVALDEYGYIVADESTKTNIPGVYAVGDVRTKDLRQVVTAVSDGATAIHFAEEYLS